ncbi:MAG: tRNA dihydrouridine(20/20a) synthase DusA [Myxococcota bacterium]|nr:tRNA dihydrouridine(20/20a) synthase DusA [Myxococcota bacterium]
MASRHPVSIAPMMKRTDRHFRYFMRGISKHALLYTEMVTTGALIHGPRERLLRYHADEHPISLQLGGDDPNELRLCARMAEDAGYDEVNLNVGCPSDRVQNGQFGACLMKRPERVAEAVVAMKAEVRIPVTVKHRIGVDDLDQYEDMLNFVDIVSKAKADRFSVHARKAWLQGLNPKENREIPPLRYDEVYELKRVRPDLEIEINGGIKTIESMTSHLEHVDAVMIGRAVYENPWLFHDVDTLWYGADSAPCLTRLDAVERMIPYIEEHVRAGGSVFHILRHMLGLFAGQRRGKWWRRFISERFTGGSGDLATLREAIDGMRGSLAA